MAPKPVRTAKVPLSKICGILVGAATVYLLVIKSHHGAGLLLDPAHAQQRGELQLPHAPTRAEQEQEEEEEVDGDPMLAAIDQKLAAMNASRSQSIAAPPPPARPAPMANTGAAPAPALPPAPAPPPPPREVQESPAKIAEDDALDKALAGLSGPLDGDDGGQTPAATGDSQAQAPEPEP